MRVEADAEALLKALAALVPFVATDKDAGPAGMVHLAYVPQGGLVATAYGKASAAAWVPAETADGDLSVFAVELADVKMIVGAFRKAFGALVIDVQAKELKSVVTIPTIGEDGHDAVASVDRREVAYSIQFSEGTGLFGNRMVKVSTAAQAEVNLEQIWAELQHPLAYPVPALEEYGASTSYLGLFKAAEKVYGEVPRFEATSIGGSLIVRVGADFIGRVFGTGASEKSDGQKAEWMQRLAATTERAA